jgi:hypothetical protein
MHINCELVLNPERLKLLLSCATLMVGTSGGVVAYQSFLRTEKWKKAEFLADAMKEFFADDRVKKTLLFIDWGARRIQILPVTSPDEGKVVVDRLLQARALRPHEIGSNLFDGKETVENSEGEVLSRFEPSEVIIRDCYDGFLDGLETFASYVETSLVEVKSLGAYIGYWLRGVQEPAEGPKEAAWKASLLTYISYYEYPRVIWLFEQFGYDIKPSSDSYRQLLAKMTNQQYASALARTVGLSYP